MLLLCIQSYAQKASSDYAKLVDSLESKIDTYAKIDSNYLLDKFLLSWVHIKNHEYEKGIRLALQARSLAAEHEYPVGDGLYLRTLSILHDEKGGLRPNHVLTRWHFDDLKRKEPLAQNIINSSGKTGDEIIHSLIATLNTFKDIEEVGVTAHISLVLANKYFQNQDLPQAYKYVESAQQLFSDLQDPIHRIQALKLKIKILKWQGEEKDIRPIELEMTQVAEAHVSGREKAILYHILSNYHWEVSGQVELTNFYALKSIPLLESLAEKYFLSTIYWTVGASFHFLEMNTKSVEYLEKCIRLREDENITDTDPYSYLYIFHAYRLIDVSDLVRAQKFIDIADSLNVTDRDILDARGQLLMAKGEYDQALEIFYELGELSNVKRGEPTFSLYLDSYIANCLNQLDRYEESNLYARAAYEQSLDGGYREPILKKACLLLYENYENLGLDQQAFNFLKIYAEIATKSDQELVANRASNLEIQNIVEQASVKRAELELVNTLQEQANQNQKWWLFSVSTGLLAALLIVFLLSRINRNKQKVNIELEKQKSEISRQKNQTEQALGKLQSTQARLIQSEKMASLGELTAGIAHEIQNPLNFVNNFSEVSAELVDEVGEELEKGDIIESKSILFDLKKNINKISHHGNRASSIVKGMLDHSRINRGEKIATDINALCDEYLRLAYHGLRARDKNFNASFETDLDPELPNIAVVPQEWGRVLLNLINNAFQAVSSKALAKQDGGYQAEVIVSTRKLEDGIEISVSDNGPGIPDEIKDKIFQPFFTTKPTGEGTGLGLSLAYDIVKAHGGKLAVNSGLGKGTTFEIQLPTANIQE